jgi:uncharacterized protein involved in exopolysaccharide biosynthesis
VDTLTSTKTSSLADRLAAIKRRSTLLVSVMAAVLVVSALAAFLWPATYRSTGTILIEQQEVPIELVRSTISSYADQRIQVITQRVMTTENLLKIVHRYGLYEKELKTKTREEVLARMRKDIDFQMISADVVDPRQGRPTKATIAFSVSYSNGSPELAARVANELISLYLQENIDNRKQRTVETTTFLGDEGERLNGHIAELDAKLAKFKELHADELPELSQMNQQQVTRTEDEVLELDSRLRSLDQQVTYLDAQLAQLSPTSSVYTSTGERVLSPSDRLKYLRTEYARLSGIYSPDHPDVVRTKREMESLEKSAGVIDVVNDLNRQLDQARTDLKSAKDRYAPDHPDVIRQERLVASLTTQLQAAIAKNDGAKAATQDPDNPAYIQIKAQREASVNEKASLIKKRAELKRRIDELEANLAKSPGVERDYKTILMELDNTQLKYREVRAKQMEAQLGQNLEEERKGERFTLIEPPLAPEKPASPNRVGILVIGIVLALGGGIGAVFLRDSMDTSVRNRHDLETLLSVPPLAVLPWIETDEDRSRKRKRMGLTLAGMFGSLALAVALTHLLYKPLDVLWAVAVRRLVG